MNEFIESIDLIMNDTYPRGLGNPARGNPDSGYHIAYDSMDVFKFCENNNFTNVYYSIFGFEQYDDPATDSKYAIIDTIPFDFDSKTLQDSLNDAKILYLWCVRHNIYPRITFSGGKGFHIFIDIEPIVLRNPKNTLIQFCDELSTSAKFTTVDRIIFGDTNRLIRIPNTVHKVTGLYCIPLIADEFLNLTLDDILILAETPQYIGIKRVNNHSDEIISTLLDIDATMPIYNDVRMIPNAESKLSRIFAYKPIGNCRAAETLVAYGTDEGTRDLALSGIIRYYTMKGLTKDEIYKKCVMFDSHCDRSLRRSTISYKVNYHMAKTYSPCTFLKRIGGICDGCSKFY